jgi:hypothetical protein
VRTHSIAIEVVGNGVGSGPEGAAMPQLRTWARSRPGVRFAVHGQGVGRPWRREGAGVTMEVRASVRSGVEARQSAAVEHKLCMKGGAAEYAHLVWLRAMQAVCTAVRYVPTSARSVASQRGEHRAATGIAGGFRCKVQPNTSFKRTRNGMAPGPRGRLVYHRPRGPGSTPLRAA